MTCGAICESIRVPYVEVQSRVIHVMALAGFIGFLKNNTKSQPAWQEIVDFSYERPGRAPLTGAASLTRAGG